MTLRELLGREATAVAEVGVYEGRGAASLRVKFPTATLYLIDPWCPNTIARRYEIDNSREKWARVEAKCRERFANDTRVVFIKLDGYNASLQIANASLDVIKLDAGREYGCLQAHIIAWLPKLAPGGIMLGGGLAGRWRSDVNLVLNDRWPGQWQQIGYTTWAVKVDRGAK